MPCIADADGTVRQEVASLLRQCASQPSWSHNPTRPTRLRGRLAVLVCFLSPVHRRACTHRREMLRKPEKKRKRNSNNSE